MATLLLLAMATSLGLDPLTHWGSLTDGLRSPARVAVAADGTVFVTDPFSNHIARFDSSGNLLGTWPVPEGPIGVATHPDGRFFVSLRDEAAVGIYIDDAGVLTRIGDLDGNGSPLVTFVRPTDIDVDPGTGRVYVVDAEADEVYGFASDGELVLKFGIRGEGNAQFMYPSAIAFDAANNRLIVADHDNFRAQIFDTGGIFLDRFGFRMMYLPGGEQEGWMPRTQGLAVDATGHVYMTDALMCTVRVYGPDTTHLGKVVQYGFEPGDLRTPCDLALSPDGSRLYVVSTNTSSVEIYETPAWGIGLSGESGGASDPSGTNACQLDPLAPATPIRSRLTCVRKSVPSFGGPTTPTEDLGDPDAEPVFRADYEGPHMIDATIICGRCHGITGQPGGHAGLLEGQAVLCMSCHSAGGQALTMPMHERDLADPYATNPNAADARGISHAWGVPAVSALADSIGPPAGSEMERYLDANGNIKCATCHDQHSNDAGAPYLRAGNIGDAMCKTCHAPRNEGPGELGTHPVGFDYPGGTGEYPADGEIAPLLLKDEKVECLTCHAVHHGDSGGTNDGEGDGMLLRAANDQTLCQTCHTEHVGHSPGGAWQPTCENCHDIHDPDNENLSLVAASVYNQTLGEDKPVIFTARTGPNSFNDGDPAQNDGVCQVCHTQTNYHLHDGSGFTHQDGQDCTICHPHGAGFMPTGGSCIDCHAAPQDNGDGVPPGGRRAVVGEFPVGDPHAHYGAELDNDACTVCHYMSAHMSGTVNLIDADTEALYSFVTPEQLATDPDTSDFCQSCHDVDGATRLATPFDPFANGNTAPDVASKFLGSLQWNEWYGDTCNGEEGTERGVNSHHDISDIDQLFSGARIECLHCHSAHGSGASQPLVDPDDGLAPWSGGDNDFCLTCHDGGSGPADPGFPTLPLEVIGPVIPLRGLDSCDYTGPPWYVDYTWTHAAHGLDSKRGWDGYSGAPSYVLACTDCHDPHGSYTPTNTPGNPYMIRDFVDGTMYVDDGVRTGHQWTGPPWDTFGIARDVVVTVDDITVGWGTATGLCNVCHATWLNAYGWHSLCTGCQTCHGHGQAFGELDYVGQDDSTPCPIP